MWRNVKMENIMKYKPGDRVRIRPKDYLRNGHNGIKGIVPSMLEYAGLVTYIRYLSESHECYILEDAGGYLWHENCLELVGNLEVDAKALEDLLNG